MPPPPPPFTRTKQAESQPQRTDYIDSEEEEEEAAHGHGHGHGKHHHYQRAAYESEEDEESYEQGEKRRKPPAKKFPKVRPPKSQILTPRFAPMPGGGVEIPPPMLNQEQRFGGHVVASFLYHPDVKLPSLADYIAKHIEVKIEAEYLSKFNMAYLERRIFGTEVYTSDSDVVCTLHHSGVWRLEESTPLHLAGVAAYFRVSKSRNTYPESLRHGLLSRKRTQYEGHSLKPEAVRPLRVLGTMEELSQLAAKMPPPEKTYKRKKPIVRKFRKMHEIQNRMTYDLANDPAFVFSLQELFFRENFGLAKMCQKLAVSVMYLETAEERYELSVRKETLCALGEDEKQMEEALAVWKIRVARIDSPWAKDVYWLREQEVPLKDEEVLVEGVPWAGLKWFMNGVEIEKKRGEVLTIEGVLAYRYYLRTDLIN